MSNRWAGPVDPDRTHSHGGAQLRGGGDIPEEDSRLQILADKSQHIPSQ